METRLVSKIGRFYTAVPCLCGSSRLSYFILPVHFVTGVELVLGFFGLVLVVCASFCGGFGTCCVWRVADLGPLPLLVGMDDPWFRSCCVWAGSGNSDWG